MATTSPLARPRRAKPAATRRAPAATCPIVSVRPLGPSMSTGWSARSRACRRMKLEYDTSGIATSACGLRKITMALMLHRQRGRAHAQGLARLQRVGWTVTHRRDGAGDEAFSRRRRRSRRDHGDAIDDRRRIPRRAAWLRARLALCAAPPVLDLALGDRRDRGR